MLIKNIFNVLVKNIKSFKIIKFIKIRWLETFIFIKILIIQPMKGSRNVKESTRYYAKMKYKFDILVISSINLSTHGVRRSDLC